MKWKFDKIGFKLRRFRPPEQVFHEAEYLRHNARRLEHLASLQLETAGRTVLEVGAGIGDHSGYYLDRGCPVTITEARPENLAVLSARYPGRPVLALDVEAPRPVAGAPFEIVHCYGLLYHLAQPDRALEFLASQCSGRLMLETCVSFGSEIEMHPVQEDRFDPSQANSGRGCRPTRAWIFATLTRLFPHVYVPRTQPNHEQFPIDWTQPGQHLATLQRAVFIASRNPLTSPLLSSTLLELQSRQP